MTVETGSCSPSFYISIHTSAREVTFLEHFNQLRCNISIHTSAREVTRLIMSCVTFTYISIHTSAREVTPFQKHSWALVTYFNPHFREGSDNNISQKSILLFMKHLQTYLNLISHIVSNILCMQKYNSILFIFSGANLLVILCMLKSRTCRS